MYDAELIQKLTVIKNVADYFKDLGVLSSKSLGQLISGDTWKLIRDTCFPSAEKGFDSSSLQVRCCPDGWKLCYRTWHTSYHNGDSFGEEEYLAAFTPEVVEAILTDLDAQYEQRELAEGIKREKKRLEDELIARVKKSIRPARERFKC